MVRNRTTTVLATIVLVAIAWGTSLGAPRDARWERVHAARKAGLPRTAIQQLDPIIREATRDGADAEAIRAIIERVRLEASLEGDKPEVAVKRLRTAVERAPRSQRPVLDIVLAQWTWQYFRQNRGRIVHRSVGGTEGADDLTTWDLPRIYAEVDRLLTRALSEPARLQRVPIAEYSALLEPGTAPDAYRPTLYDFALFQAIDFYTSGEQAGARPDDAFTLPADGPILRPATEFVSARFATGDSTSPLYRAVRLYQDALRFHSRDADPSAHFDADLARLQFGRYRSVGAVQDSLYTAALEDLAKRHAGRAYLSRVWGLLARQRFAQGDRSGARRIAQRGLVAPLDSVGATDCAQVIAHVEAPELSVQADGVWNVGGAEIIVRSRNVPRVWFRVVRPQGPDFWVREWDALRPWFTDDGARLLALPPVRAWAVDLARDSTFAGRVDTLAAPTDLPSGYYILVVSTEGAFQAKNLPIAARPFWASDLALIVRPGTPGSVEGLVVDARSGEPLEGVRARGRGSEDGAAMVESRSDGNGHFALSGFDGGAVGVEVEHRGQVLAIPDPQWVAREDVQRPRQETLFFTDRALYRPGQLVRYKGLCLEADTDHDDYETLNDHPVRVVLRDANRREIARREHRTNDRGSFSGSFELPAATLLGEFSLETENGPDGVRSFRVEEYKRPKFAVTLEKPRAPGRHGEEAILRGSAMGYAGAPIGGAKVAWRVDRGASFPSWWWWRGGRRQGSEPARVAQGEVQTDGEGGFTIAFPATPDPAVDPASQAVFDYTVHVDVTEPSGETRSASASFRVGSVALAAQILGEQWQTTDVPVAMTVGTTTLDGVGVAGTGTLTVHALRTPERVARTDSRGEETWPRWGDASEVAHRAVATDSSGTGRVEMKLPAGAYRARFVTKDRFGSEVTAEWPFLVLDLEARRGAVREPQLLRIRDHSPEVGEEFVAVWSSGHQNARAYVEIEHRGRILQAYWTPRGRTQAVIRQRVSEEMRGGFVLRVSMVHDNRAWLHFQRVDVPWSDRELLVRWDRLQSKLEPGVRTTWTASIARRDGAPVDAEMVATLYDASLDAFAPRDWPSRLEVFRSEYDLREARFANALVLLRPVTGRWPTWPQSTRLEYRRFPDSVRFGEIGFNGVREVRVSAQRMIDTKSSTTRQSVAGESLFDLPIENLRGAISLRAGFAVSGGELHVGLGYGNALSGADVLTGGFDAERAGALRGSGATSAPTPAPRRNFEETAFFFPHLLTDAQGGIRMEFTMPEALTRWRFLGFAHDRALRSGLLVGTTVTSRDLTVEANPPRFLREGDVVEFPARITNRGKGEMRGDIRIALTDAATGDSVNAAFAIDQVTQAFTVPAGGSRTHTWRLRVPDGAGMLIYRVTADGGSLSDAEENALPVLARRILVTESLPVSIRGPGERRFDFASLGASGGSGTLRHQSLTVQMVSNPAWYAVMALPYLMEFPHECSEQTFNRLYANAVAQYVANSDPEIRQVFDRWKTTEALASPLAKNAELHSRALEASPWLRQAQSESESRRNLGILFDTNRLNGEIARLEERMARAQNTDGGWPWFPGGKTSDYMTLYLVSSYGRLRRMGLDVDDAPARRALDCVDRWSVEEHRRASEPGRTLAKRFGADIVLYLYGRSFYRDEFLPSSAAAKARDAWLEVAREHWLELPGRQLQARLAIALQRFGDGRAAAAILASLRERAIVDDELGMFWREGESSWWWYQAPIETQATLIEAFAEVAADSAAVEECKIWLLRQKQAQAWKTTTATADAVYSLLLRGSDLLASRTPVAVALDGQRIRPDSVEAGTGYYEKRYAPAQITPALARIHVAKSDPGIAWGGVHWQYFEELSQVKAQGGTALQVDKRLFVRRTDARGVRLEPVTGPLAVGDELVVRLVVRADRAFEYVHLADERPSGVEPTEVLSGHIFGDGLVYYRETRDTGTHFFIENLPRGTSVLEHASRVQLRGRYPTGLARLECMYAPEFGAHSASVMLEVR